MFLILLTIILLFELAMAGYPDLALVQGISNFNGQISTRDLTQVTGPLGSGPVTTLDVSPPSQSQCNVGPLRSGDLFYLAFTPPISTLKFDAIQNQWFHQGPFLYSSTVTPSLWYHSSFEVLVSVIDPTQPMTLSAVYYSVSSMYWHANVTYVPNSANTWSWSLDQLSATTTLDGTPLDTGSVFSGQFTHDPSQVLRMTVMVSGSTNSDGSRSTSIVWLFINKVKVNSDVTNTITIPSIASGVPPCSSLFFAQTLVVSNFALHNFQTYVVNSPSRSSALVMDSHYHFVYPMPLPPKVLQSQVSPIFSQKASSQLVNLFDLIKLPTLFVPAKPVYSLSISNCSSLLQHYTLISKGNSEEGTHDSTISECSDVYNALLFTSTQFSIKELSRVQIKIDFSITSGDTDTKSTPVVISLTLMTTTDLRISINSGLFTKLSLATVPQILNLDQAAIQSQFQSIERGNAFHRVSSTFNSLSQGTAFDWNSQTVGIILDQQPSSLISGAVQTCNMEFQIVYSDSSFLTLRIDVNFFYILPQTTPLQVYYNDGSILEQQVKRLSTAQFTVFESTMATGEVQKSTTTLLVSDTDWVLVSPYIIPSQSKLSSGELILSSKSTTFQSNDDRSEVEFTFYLGEPSLANPAQIKRFSDDIKMKVFPSLQLTATQNSTKSFPQAIPIATKGYLNPLSQYRISMSESAYFGDLPSRPRFLLMQSSQSVTLSDLTTFTSDVSFSDSDVLYILKNLYSTENPIPTLAVVSLTETSADGGEKTVGSTTASFWSPGTISNQKGWGGSVTTIIIVVCVVVFVIIATVIIVCVIKCIRAHREYKVKQLQVEQIRHFEDHVQQLATITANLDATQKIDEPSAQTNPAPVAKTHKSSKVN